MSDKRNENVMEGTKMNEKNEKAVSENEAAELANENLENVNGGAYAPNLLFTWHCPYCDFYTSAGDRSRIKKHKESHNQG